MAVRKRKAAPADPMAILRASAARRAQDLALSRDPASWGIETEHLELKAANDVDAVLSGVRADGRVAVREARRLDAFDQLHKAGGLDAGQHQAALRLMKDTAEQFGIRTTDGWKTEQIDGGDASELVTQRMIDAGRRIDQVLRLVGLADKQLLKELVRVVVFEQAGVTTNWRGTVQKLTGESDRMCQGGRVRAACENLRLGYDQVDRAAAVAGRPLDFSRTEGHAAS